MKTHIDWLRFRTQSNPFEVLEALRPLFGTASDLVEFHPGLKGQDGWLRAGELKLAGDVSLGRIDYEGESQRGWVRVNLTGEGCGWVQDWQAAEALRDVLKQPEIRRLDIALTTYAGEVTHDQVIEAHGRGRFSSGGRQPHYRVIGGSDPRAGRTIYVGKREGSDKMLRCYEKGFEMLTKVPESLRATVTHIDGHLVAEIYRVELELKAETKHIPWTALQGRDEVFAGAYPFCAELLPGAAHVKLQTLPDFGPRVALESAIDNCRRSYGAIIRAALLAHGGDGRKVLERLASETPSRALIEAGVLTVAHP
jgi:phage replication initiation protein